MKVVSNLMLLIFSIWQGVQAANSKMLLDQNCWQHLMLFGMWTVKVRLVHPYLIPQSQTSGSTNKASKHFVPCSSAFI